MGCHLERSPFPLSGRPLALHSDSGTGQSEDKDGFNYEQTA
jgi:hypothetical protein